MNADLPKKNGYQKNQYGKLHSLSKEQFIWKKKEIKSNMASDCKRMNINTE